MVPSAAVLAQAPRDFQSPFPETPRVVYRKNPLAEVICQLRYPTILEIGTGEPADFQGKIRDTYPLYRRDQSAALPADLAEIISKFGVQPPMPVVHRFTRLDEHYSCTLTTDAIALTCGEYTEWAEFQRELSLLRSAFEDTYRPAVYTRIGLRYINVIDREKQLGLGKIGWQELVTTKLCGPLVDDAVRELLEDLKMETLVRLPIGKVKLRAGLAETQDDSRDVFVIDSDFFFDERTESNDVDKALSEFNRNAGNLFRWAITRQLSDALEPIPAQRG